MTLVNFFFFEHQPERLRPSARRPTGWAPLARLLPVDLFPFPMQSQLKDNPRLMRDSGVLIHFPGAIRAPAKTPGWLTPRTPRRPS